MSNTIYTHYVYRITNVLLNKHYYGSRSCKNCHPKDDLGIKYFSSSLDKEFKKDQKEHPEHYRYKIIRICESRNDALELEVLLHNKFDVGMNGSFYNNCKATSSGFSRYGVKLSEDTLKKMSEAKKGKHFSDEHRKKLSKVRKGKHIAEENPFYGKKHTEETKKKISESLKGKYIGEKNYRFKGYYITPFGTFASSMDTVIKENNISDVTLTRWCKINNDKVISKIRYACSKYLKDNFDESIIGKTFADIGFSFEATR